MKLPAIEGIIRRRVLVNYRVAPDAMARALPAPFRPKLHRGWAIGGVCLIRLEQIRPHGAPALIGHASENAAHRMAVTWEDNGVGREGVYVPRRDTDSRLNRLLGGRLFPGQHHGATFKVNDNGHDIQLHVSSNDGAVTVRVRGSKAANLPSASVFRDMAEASDFFEAGSMGYSATSGGKCFEGLRLETAQWRIEPLEVESEHSSFFSDTEKFPAGSVEFDCALVMRDIEHRWLGLPELSA